ncbi:hypothetical protein KIN20_000679 [Parelaphostrongylus tenuis]|uniref:Uncharacterized protein n=1 Tax=Parelaphostrongylus tenuis TaxID=148309 RepID=A0AAD5QFR1_PARTN|nr:hypothetical protein KIN20_000679 [Parelaphostrongylus tenuis]
MIASLHCDLALRRQQVNERLTVIDRQVQHQRMQRRTDLCAALVELPGCDDFCPLKWLVALPSCYGLNFGLCDRVFCQLVSCNRQEHKVQILYMGYTKQCGETEQ